MKIAGAGTMQMVWGWEQDLWWWVGMSLSMLNCGLEWDKWVFSELVVHSGHGYRAWWLCKPAFFPPPRRLCDSRSLFSYYLWQVNIVNGGHNAFNWCTSVCLSLSVCVSAKSLYSQQCHSIDGQFTHIILHYMFSLSWSCSLWNGFISHRRISMIT